MAEYAWQSCFMKREATDETTVVSPDLLARHEKVR
jgi:hypothetical protein